MTAWHAYTPWQLRRNPTAGWATEWAQRRLIPLTMTFRDGIRFYLRTRLATRQADAAIGYVERQPCPAAPWQADLLLEEALELGLTIPAYPHDPMSEGERPARSTMTT